MKLHPIFQIKSLFSREKKIKKKIKIENLIKINNKNVYLTSCYFSFLFIFTLFLHKRLHPKRIMLR